MSSRVTRAEARRAVGDPGALPLLVLALVLAAAFLVTGAAWSFSSPVGSSPDDDHHLASIYCPNPIENSGCPLVTDAAGKAVGVRVPIEVAKAPCYGFNKDASGNCELKLSETELMATDRVDRGGYPGGFFIAAHQLVGSGVDATVVRVRLANVALASLLIGLLVWSAPTGAASRVAAVFLITATPVGLFFIASTNPSAWALVGVPGFYVALHALLVDDRPRFRWVHAGLALASAAMACAARSDAAVYIVVVAALALFRGSAGLLRLVDVVKRLKAWLVVPVVALAFVAWSLLQGRQASVAAATEGLVDPGRDPNEILVNNLVNLPAFVGGFGGLSWGLGWLDTLMPTGAAFPPLFAAGVLIFGALRGARWDKLVAMAGVVAVMVFIPMYILTMQRQFVGEYVQPRYLLPLWSVLVAVAVLRSRNEDAVAPFTRLQAALVWGGVAVAQALALYTNLRRYLTGLDGPYLLTGTVEWWWNMAGSLEGQGFLGQLASTPRTWLVAGALAYAVACGVAFTLGELDRRGGAASAQG